MNLRVLLRDHNLRTQDKHAHAFDECFGLVLRDQYFEPLRTAPDAQQRPDSPLGITPCAEPMGVGLQLRKVERELTLKKILRIFASKRDLRVIQCG